MTHYENPKQPVSARLAEFGQRLEAYRLARQMRQEDLARSAGISRSTLHRIESGRGGTMENLFRVLGALDLEAGIDGLVPHPRLSPLDPHPHGRPRQRARPREAPSGAEEEGWSWGE